MNDKQRLLIDCISLLPVIGILVLITVANDQFVTMVAAYVLCGELLCVLVSRVLYWCGFCLVGWSYALVVVLVLVGVKPCSDGNCGKDSWMNCFFSLKNPRSFLHVFVYNFFGLQWDRECGFTFTAFVSKKQISYKTCWEIESQWLVWILL